MRAAAAARVGHRVRKHLCEKECLRFRMPECLSQTSIVGTVGTRSTSMAAMPVSRGAPWHGDWVYIAVDCVLHPGGRGKAGGPRAPRAVGDR